MTVATRLAVQTSPRKPNASAPCASNPGSCARCSAVSFGSAPGRGRLFRAVTPPARPRRIHWLTAPAVTPSASAIFCWLQPFAFNAHARSRRSSRHSFARPGACPILQGTAQVGPALAFYAKINNTVASEDAPGRGRGEGEKIRGLKSTGPARSGRHSSRSGHVLSDDTLTRHRHATPGRGSVQGGSLRARHVHAVPGVLWR